MGILEAPVDDDIFFVFFFVSHPKRQTGTISHSKNQLSHIAVGDKDKAEGG